MENQPKKIQKNKIKIYSLIMCGIVFICSLSVYIKYVFQDNEQVMHTLLSSTSPSGSYEIIIKYQEPFTFGPQNINVYYKSKGNTEKELLTTEIHNDGKDLDSSNYDIKWNNDLVTLVFKGEEQADEIFLLNMNGDQKVISVQHVNRLDQR